MPDLAATSSMLAVSACVSVCEAEAEVHRRAPRALLYAESFLHLRFIWSPHFFLISEDSVDQFPRVRALSFWVGYRDLWEREESFV